MIIYGQFMVICVGKKRPVVFNVLRCTHLSLLLFEEEVVVLVVAEFGLGVLTIVIIGPVIIT